VWKEIDCAVKWNAQSESLVVLRRVRFDAFFSI
jgi:hypothetical protein